MQLVVREELDRPVEVLGERLYGEVRSAVLARTDIIEGASVSMGLAIGLVVWLAIFIGLAVVAVRATAETV